MAVSIFTAARRWAPAILFAAALPLASAEPQFYRAVNLNGPALPIDGQAWEAGGAENLAITGSAFENQNVPLKPSTDKTRAQMIRSSRWGSKVDVELKSVPEGAYQIFLYVWEDNHTEKFDLLVNDRMVMEGFYSGNAGSWRRLGPWPALSVNGKLKVSARGGAANLSGVEVWSGEGAVPEAPSPSFVANPSAEQVEFFEKRIRPVLVEHCYECHSAGAKKIKGGLVLDSRAGVMKGGDSGPVLLPGDPDASHLIQAVRHADEDLAMPPKVKLPAEIIADLEKWVREGAPDPRTEDTLAAAQAKTSIDWNKAREWWSFRPISAPALPEVQRKEWPANGVDRFILARMEKEGLAPSGPAEKRALIRRAAYDLTGLPPTPEEIQQFLADTSASAFATVVDRLLASPAYGERWGRHWLDVARYADTAGDNSDFPIPQMHRYRNWVIDAFNRDLPYDQFVREQLAGDLLPAADEKDKRQKIIATGYLANARRFGSRVDDYPQHLTIEDTLDNLGRAFLGLTINCSRCHDHKFDPITAQDYYALYGIFQSTRYPWPGIELDQKQRDFVPLAPKEEVESARKTHREEQAKLDGEVKRLEKEVKTAEGGAKKDLEKSLETAKKAAQKHGKTPLPFEQAYAVAEAKPVNAAVQFKGDPAKVGPVVPRRFLTVLGGAALSPEETSSGRRQLAEWIVDPKNPLFARVMVNRIWQYHFGRGLVPTANDFGKQGKPPTHPELLDWLAGAFRDSGWSIKAMHRLMMLSQTYQQETGRSDAARERDPNNECLSGFPRRRLDAESIRDTLLAVGGALERGQGGAHPFPPQTEWNFTQHNPFKAVYESNRRSVYLMTQRIQRHPFLATFDGADPATSTPSRPSSTTPVQALYFLNDPLAHEQARRFAERILKSSADDTARVQFAYQAALGRPAQDDEVSADLQFLSAVSAQLREMNTPADKIELQQWQAFARVLFRLNEFVYLD